MKKNTTCVTYINKLIFFLLFYFGSNTKEHISDSQSYVTVTDS